METSDLKLKDNPLLSVVGKTDKNKDKALSNLKLKPKGKRKKHDSLKMESEQSKYQVLPPVPTLIPEGHVESESIIQYKKVNRFSKVCQMF